MGEGRLSSSQESEILISCQESERDTYTCTCMRQNKSSISLARDGSARPPGHWDDPVDAGCGWKAFARTPDSPPGVCVSMREIPKRKKRLWLFSGKREQRMLRQVLLVISSGDSCKHKSRESLFEPRASVTGTSSL